MTGIRKHRGTRTRVQPLTGSQAIESRRFLGVIGGDVRDRFKRNLNNKHLRAYLRGDRFFSFQRDNQGNPLIYMVMQQELPKGVPSPPELQPSAVSGPEIIPY